MLEGLVRLPLGNAYVRLDSIAWVEHQTVSGQDARLDLCGSVISMSELDNPRLHTTVADYKGRPVIAFPKESAPMVESAISISGVPAETTASLSCKIFSTRPVTGERS